MSVIKTECLLLEALTHVLKNIPPHEPRDGPSVERRMKIDEMACVAGTCVL